MATKPRRTARKAAMPAEIAPSQPGGTAAQKLDPPEQAGEISVAEVAEIKERTRIRDHYQKMFDETQAELRNLATMLAIVRSEYTTHLQNLCMARGLDLRDGFDVATESGVIWRTHRHIEPILTEELTEAAVETSTNGSTQE